MQGAPPRSPFLPDQIGEGATGAEGQEPARGVQKESGEGRRDEGEKGENQEQERRACKTSTKETSRLAHVCGRHWRGNARCACVQGYVHVCTCVCARRKCVKSILFSYPGLDGERGVGAGGAGLWCAEAARWVSGLQKCFNWGLQPRAQLHCGPQITSEWLARRGELRKPGQNLRVRSGTSNGSARSRDSFRV